MTGLKGTLAAEPAEPAAVLIYLVMCYGIYYAVFFVAGGLVFVSNHPSHLTICSLMMSLRRLKTSLSLELTSVIKEFCQYDLYG